MLLHQTRRPYPRPPRPPPRGCPRLEALEDRTLPALIPVTTFADVVADDGMTSLREAIAKAADAMTNPGPDTIQLPAGTYNLSLGQLTINDATGAVTIKSPEKGPATINAQGNSRVIRILAGSTAEFVNLTLTGGFLGSGAGGGIVNSGTLTLRDSTVSGNRCQGTRSVTRLGDRNCYEGTGSLGPPEATAASCLTPPAAAALPG